MLITNYIIQFFKSLVTTKISARDFLFIIVIGILLFKAHFASTDNLGPKTLPTLAPVAKEKAKDGTQQTVIPTVVLTKSGMQSATKDIRKNLKLVGVQSVDKIVTHVDFSSPELPTTLDDINHIITDKYEDKNITLNHTYNTNTKLGQFEFHLTPDTETIVHGVKTHWFKPNEYSVHVNHTNPLFNDQMGSSATYKEPRVWLVIGPSAGFRVIYQDNKWSMQPAVGITATVPIITFKRKK